MEASTDRSSSTAAADRILLVVPQPFYEDRGTSIALHHFLRALSDLGQPVDVLCFEPGRDVGLPGVRILRAPNPFGFERVPIGLSARKLLLDAFLLRALRRRLTRERYLYVHAVEEAALLAAALRGRGQNGAPAIPPPAGARGPGAPDRRSGPFVAYDMQSSLPEQLLQYRGFRNPAAQALVRRIEARLLRDVDLVVCSEGLEDRVQDVAPGTPVLAWRFPASMEPPLRGERERLRTALGLRPGLRIVLYIGSFARYQGVPLLGEAMARVLAAVPDAAFVAVGAASRRELSSLRSRVPDELAARVRVLPRIDRAQVPAYLALADVLLLPRIHGSNLSLKTFDYLAAGKAIVASDLPTHRWLDREGVALLAPSDPAAFAGAVRRVLENPVLADRLRRAARDYAESHLQWSQFTGLVEDLVAHVRARRPSAR